MVFSAEGLRATAGTDSLGRGLIDVSKQTKSFLAVTDGANDVLWLDDGELRQIPAFRVDVVDTLGAGDTFHGAFTLMLAEGMASGRRCASRPRPPRSNARAMAAFSARRPAPRSRRFSPRAMIDRSGEQLFGRDDYALDSLARADSHGLRHELVSLLNDMGRSGMRRRALFTGILALAPCCRLGAAHAQGDWPAGKTIRIIVPFPPGGTVDIVTRLLTQPLGAALNTSVIIENKPGAGTNIATEMVVRAAPDGLTLLMGGVPNAINETLYPNLNFNLRRDLVGVTLVASLPNVLVVNPGVPASTLAEFIALNKAKPGTINFASGGIGTTPHLCAVMFGMMIDAPVTHVPYRGSAPASQDLVAGQVQAMFDSVGSALPQIQAGRLRPLAVTGRERAALLAGVPTMGEGGVKDFVVTSWSGLMAPSATPPDIVRKIATEVDNILASAEVRKILTERGYATLGGGSQAFEKYLDADIALWAKVVRQSGATVN